MDTPTYPLFTRTLGELSPVLLSPESLDSVSKNNPAYYVVRGPEESGMLGPNITILPPWKVGQEYAKTFGHYHQHGEQERYKVLLGKALCLMQKVDRASDRLVEARAVVAGEGSFIDVPSGYGHLLINTTNEVLITADWEPASSSHLYEDIELKRGFSYYIVAEGGRLTSLPNALYDDLPSLEWTYL